MEAKNREYRFSKVCLEILKNEFKEIQTEVILSAEKKSVRADVITHDEVKSVFEIKYYRSKIIDLKIIENALKQLRDMRIMSESDEAYLILSIKLDPYYKNSFEIDYGVSIIDIENILFLISSRPKLKAELFDILSIQNENDEKYTEAEFHFVKQPNIVFNFDHTEKDKTRKKSVGENLLDSLSRIKPGNSNFSRFEKVGSEILEYLFGRDLNGWHLQKTTDDGLYRYDVICRITSDKSIWKCFE